MYKKVLHIVLIFSTILLFAGCKKNDTVILFNHSPITRENYLQNDFYFKKGERIYYLFMTQKELDTTMVKIKVLKREEKASYAISKLVYANDYKLFKDQVYYYTNYFVLHDKGCYCVEIYAKNKLNKPLVRGDFKVVDD